MIYSSQSSCCAARLFLLRRLIGELLTWWRNCRKVKVQFEISCTWIFNQLQKKITPYAFLKKKKKIHPLWAIRDYGINAGRRSPLCASELVVLFNCEAVVRHCWQHGAACQVHHPLRFKQTRICSRATSKRRGSSSKILAGDACTSHATGSRDPATTNGAVNA